MVPWVRVRVASNAEGEAGIADPQRAVEVANGNAVIGGQLADVVGQIADEDQDEQLRAEGRQLAAQLTGPQEDETATELSTRVSSRMYCMKSSGCSKS